MSVKVVKYKGEYWKDILYRAKKNKIGYLFILPFSIVFFTFSIFPVLISIFYSFCNYNILQPPTFIGWGNYVKLFFQDYLFPLTIRNTLILAVLTGPASYIICLMVAWFVNELKPKLRAFLTLLFYAPALTGVTGIWLLILSSDRNGYLNSFLLSLGLINSPVQWFVNPATIKIAVVLVVLWSSLGVGFLSFIAGFQNVDRTLYEAGAVDGITSRYQELWYITLPSMRGQLMFSAVMTITQAFGIGDVITQLCGFPSSGYEAHTIMNHLKDYGMIRYEMGYASAIATVLFIIMVVTNKLAQKIIQSLGK